jgi:hypothetical protein
MPEPLPVNEPELNRIFTLLEDLVGRLTAERDVLQAQNELLKRSLEMMCRQDFRGEYVKQDTP